MFVLYQFINFFNYFFIKTNSNDEEQVDNIVYKQSLASPILNMTENSSYMANNSSINDALNGYRSSRSTCMSPLNNSMQQFTAANHILMNTPQTPSTNQYFAEKISNGVDQWSNGLKMNNSINGKPISINSSTASVTPPPSANKTNELHFYEPFAMASPKSQPPNLELINDEQMMSKCFNKSVYVSSPIPHSSNKYPDFPNYIGQMNNNGISNAAGAIGSNQSSQNSQIQPYQYKTSENSAFSKHSHKTSFTMANEDFNSTTDFIIGGFNGLNINTNVSNISGSGSMIQSPTIKSPRFVY